jgi:hypothetical protein
VISEVQFYQVLAAIWLGITVLRVVIIVGKKKLKDGEAWIHPLLSALLFGAYTKIVDLLTALTK